MTAWEDTWTNFRILKGQKIKIVKKINVEVYIVNVS